MKAPVIDGVLNRANAHTASILCERRQLGFLICGFAERVGLQGVIVGNHLAPNSWRIENIFEAQFIMREVGFMEVRALFQNHNFKSRCGKFFGYYAPSATGSHNDKVHRSFVFVRLHGWYSPALSFFRVVVTEW